MEEIFKTTLFNQICIYAEGKRVLDVKVNKECGKSLITEKNEFMVELILAEKEIGRVRFSHDAENKSFYIFFIENKTIERETRKSKFKGVGKSLLNCVKEFASKCDVESIVLRPTGIPNTLRPPNFDLETFFAFQGFEKMDAEGNPSDVKMAFLMNKI